MRVAIVHPFLLSPGGGERVVDALLELYPAADLFVLFADRRKFSPRVARATVNASLLNRIPNARQHYQWFFPLYPVATLMFDLSEYDLVISSGGPASKGVITREDAIHIHYCHSPVRFLWDRYFEWIRALPAPLRPLFALTAHFAREWDYNTSQRLDGIIANSDFVAKRVAKYYRALSVVIHPPVNAAEGYIDDNVSDYYITVGRLVPHKRFDLVIEACTQLGRKLKVVGTGPELGRLKQLAGPSIEFLGRVPDADMATLYAKSRAFIFAGKEDFGIALVEAQSFGRPVLALGEGGALEIVNHGNKAPCTGILFDQPSVPAIREAIRKFERHESDFQPPTIRNHSLSFDKQVFLQKMNAYISTFLNSNEKLRTLENRELNGDSWVSGKRAEVN